jgi:hypothetical protein
MHTQLKVQKEPTEVISLDKNEILAPGFVGAP